MQQTAQPVKVRQMLGKYRIERRVGEGGFASVFQAMDTIEGVRVALKIPHRRYITPEALNEFRREVRLAAQLKHPNILPLKNAEFIQGHFVVAFPLGERTLADRLQHRMSLATALTYAEQMLQASAYAHAHHIIHCDIKPENLILFPDHQLMLTDFGIAKVAVRTIRASGSGTVGYIAPEQAMGKPSFRSDVFSLGLIIYRMLSGHLPEWPFEWPPPCYDRLRRRVDPEMINLLQRAIMLDPKKRFADAGKMLAALRRIKSRTLRDRSKSVSGRGKTARRTDWRTLLRRQFLKQYGVLLETRYRCGNCEGPVSEAMQFCPWCSTARPTHEEATRFPQRCPRCLRGLKLDWAFCPWCFGPGFHVDTRRHYPDKRYEARCANRNCSRKLLMPFMRYCPWCRRKVRRKWKIGDSEERCSGCGWGVLGAYWQCCPWCGKGLDNWSKSGK